MINEISVTTDVKCHMTKYLKKKKHTEKGLITRQMNEETSTYVHLTVK